jgi:hypothetical protein
MQKQRFLLIHLCFFLSGAAGLIYEVVWARQLSLFLGITFYAHTAVIAAYSGITWRTMTYSPTGLSFAPCSTSPGR